MSKRQEIKPPHDEQGGPAGHKHSLPPPADENRPGRKRSGSARRQRSRMAFIRLDEAEYAELEARAGQAGLSVGAHCRMRALDDAGPRARRRVRPTVETRLLARSNAELNHLGSNLNQMARALNEIALNDCTGRLEQVAHLAQPIRRTLEQLDVALAANCRASGDDREG